MKNESKHDIWKEYYFILIDKVWIAKDLAWYKIFRSENELLENMTSTN